MTTPSVVGRIFYCAIVAMVAVACRTTDGPPTAASGSAGPLDSSSSPTPTSVPAAPTGDPIGTATMSVRGGSGSAVIRYRINGGPEQTEAHATLPWEKQYPVYDKLDTSVTADAGDTELICTIIMDGNLVSFITEVRPTCNFAYWG